MSPLVKEIHFDMCSNVCRDIISSNAPNNIRKENCHRLHNGERKTGRIYILEQHIEACSLSTDIGHEIDLFICKDLFSGSWERSNACGEANRKSKWITCCLKISAKCKQHIGSTQNLIGSNRILTLIHTRKKSIVYIVATIGSKHSC